MTVKSVKFTYRGNFHTYGICSLFEVVFIGQITLNLTRFLSITIPFVNFKATCTHFRAIREVVAVKQLKLTSFYQNTVILLLLKIKRIFRIFV